MKRVYYSLLLQHDSSDKQRVAQFITSLKSLRHYNKQLPVSLYLISQAPESDFERQLSQELKFQIIRSESYVGQLELLVPGAGIYLAQYPVLHKYLALPHLVNTRVKQLLYLDNDTFFHRDPSPLFEAHLEFDLAAREEPFTARSPLGNHHGHIQESKYEQLAGASAALLPFNTGVVLYSVPLLEQFLEQIAIFFRYLIGLFKGIARQAGQSSYHPLVGIAQALNDWDLKNNFPALSYPGENYWIIEQVALWLSLTQLQPRQTFLSTAEVLQGCEEVAFKGRFKRPIVSHYFSQNTPIFFSSQTQTQLYQSEQKLI